ncbi:MAG: M28 family peptidase [Fidelibacterota bacterium]|nr:MAG: M28 family peptidase [Candidatus Neomarinimicrobiota bacterium]
MRYVTLVTVLVICACAGRPEPTEPEVVVPPGPISVAALLSHENFLAGDSLYGRAAGSIHERRAAEYIRDEFQRYGLQPPVPEYLQSFSFVARMDMGPGNAISVSRSDMQETTRLAPDRDFRPLGFSASGTTEGTLVFAGYGITSEDPVYDDYAGLNVEDKVLMILRHSPDGTSPHGAFSNHTPLRKKVLTAREQGAVAVLFVTGSEDDNEDVLMKLRYDRAGDAGLPVVHLTRQAADRLLASAHLKIAELQNEVNTTRLPLSHELTGVQVTVTTDLIERDAESQNVLASLPGSGTLAGQWVVVGAHYDHLGWGGPGSGSMVPDTNAIHNGADDNASGTSALLELARYLTAHPHASADRRSIMFQAFGGEERGTLGSSYVTKHPPVSMDSVIAMLNMDMVGGLRDDKLLLGGAGTSPLWKELLPALNRDSLHFIYDDAGYGSSDHQSYYMQDKPVLFFFTGEHDRYHRPSDDVEFINFDGLVQVGQLVARVTEDLATRSTPPAFTEADGGRPAARADIKVGLGVIPSFTYEGEGFAISGVRREGPAARAGLQAEDVIILIGTTEIKSIYDYMYALQEVKAGEPLQVTIRRGEQELELEVIPERRRE